MTSEKKGADGAPGSHPDGEGNLAQLAAALAGMGCPEHKAGEMARQLDKRARQLAAHKGTSYDEAMAHLLGLMRQGWAAQARGF